MLPTISAPGNIMPDKKLNPFTWNDGIQHLKHHNMKIAYYILHTKAHLKKKSRKLACMDLSSFFCKVYWNCYIYRKLEKEVALGNLWNKKVKLC